MYEISRFLSTFGANGFFMFEFPLGSVIFSVKGNFLPSMYYLISSKNFYNF